VKLFDATEKFGYPCNVANNGGFQIHDYATIATNDGFTQEVKPSPTLKGRAAGQTSTATEIIWQYDDSGDNKKARIFGISTATETKNFVTTINSVQDFHSINGTNLQFVVYWFGPGNINRLDTTSPTGTTADTTSTTTKVATCSDRKGTVFVGYTDNAFKKWEIIDRSTLVISNSGSPGHSLASAEVKQSA
jgi:hypothetical protein